MTGDQRPDSELLVDLPRQPELMGVLYERYAPAVFRYLARRAGPAAAEDLLSEVFIAALDARKRVVAHHSGSALPWLYGIAMNVIRRFFRHSQPAWAVEPDLGMDWDAVDARLDAEAQRRRLRTALCTLSEPDRELLLLVAWEGLTSAEAAEALGISTPPTSPAAAHEQARHVHRRVRGRSGRGRGNRGLGFFPATWSAATQADLGRPEGAPVRTPASTSRPLTAAQALTLLP